MVSLLESKFSGCVANIRTESRSHPFLLHTGNERAKLSLVIIENIPETSLAAQAGFPASYSVLDGKTMTNGKYIPPALRGKPSTASQELPPEKPTLYTMAEIQAFFGYPSPSHGKNTGEVPGQLEEPNTRGPGRKHGTLNVAYDNQDELAYIVLFRDANPFWEDKREILCKTNLDILPNRSSVGAASSRSYPVFVQKGFSRHHNARAMAFAGYYRIQEIRYLKPLSEELVQYLQAKFGEKSRDREGWKQSLSLEWAVITMAPDDVRKGEAPEIHVMLENKKSVNEMLADLRRNS